MTRPKLGNLRTLVFARAEGRCEAINGAWRCWNPPDDLSHYLPRSRGGDTLDRVAAAALASGTFDPVKHLAHLRGYCRPCHVWQEANPAEARGRRMVAGGYVLTSTDGTVRYVGQDPVLGGLWGVAA